MRPQSPSLFFEVIETVTTRDVPFEDRDGSWGTSIVRPSGPGWRIADARRERHTKWVRRRPVVSPRSTLAGRPMNAADLAQALGGHRTGGQFLAKCPCHLDRSPSLAIRDGQLGPLLFCHAGCSTRDVIDELRGRGLWDTPARAARTFRRPEVVSKPDDAPVVASVSCGTSGVNRAIHAARLPSDI